MRLPKDFMHSSAKASPSYVPTNQKYPTAIVLHGIKSLQYKVGSKTRLAKAWLGLD